MTPGERPFAMVTGAAQRVGRAIALELAEFGCDVAVHFNHSEAAARRTAQDIEQRGVRAVTLQADLAADDAAQRLIDAALAECGRLDVLVNNASIFEPMPLDQFDIARWQRTMQINLAAPIQLVQHAADALRASGRGCVINLCDIATQRPWPATHAYGPSKAGLDHATRALARELAPDIRVNGVAPGIAVFPEGYSEQRRQALIDRVPLKRAGSPEDIAGAVRFLIESPYITGQIIAVDGGRSIE